MDEELVCTLAGHADDLTSSIDEETMNLLEQALASGFDNLRQIDTRGDRYAGPIERVVVADVVNENPEKSINFQRYMKRKPVYVCANIQKKHLGKGEKTDKEGNLRDVIRHRGSNNMADSCGQIVTPSLGGNMVDYNLFPQDQTLSRGLGGSFFVSKSLEYATRLWLTVVPESFQPRVEYAMLLKYDSTEQQHRPTNFEYVTLFYITRPERNNASERVDETMLNVGRELINVVQTASIQSTYNIRAGITDIRGRFNLPQNLIDAILKLTNELEVDLKVKAKWYRVREVSLIDFMPYAGSLKAVSDGVDDIKDGALVSGVANVALGVTSLAFDTLALTSGLTVLTTGGKIVSLAASAGVSGIRKIIL